MFKRLLISIFLPSAASLAAYASQAFADIVNKSEKEAVISKYSNLGDKAADVVKTLTVLLNDGKIDEQEKEAVKDKLTPLFEKLIDLIKSNA